MDLSELAIIVEKTTTHVSHMDFLCRPEESGQATNRLVISGQDILAKPVAFARVAANPQTQEIISTWSLWYELRSGNSGRQVDVLYGQSNQLIGSLLTDPVPDSQIFGTFLFTLCQQSEVEPFLKNRAWNDIDRTVNEIIARDEAKLADRRRLNYKEHYPRAAFGQKS